MSVAPQMLLSQVSDLMEIPPPPFDSNSSNFHVQIINDMYIALARQVFQTVFLCILEVGPLIHVTSYLIPQNESTLIQQCTMMVCVFLYSSSMRITRSKGKLGYIGEVGQSPYGPILLHFVPLPMVKYRPKLVEPIKINPITMEVTMEYVTFILCQW